MEKILYFADGTHVVSDHYYQVGEAWSDGDKIVRIKNLETSDDYQKLRNEEDQD